MLVGNFEKSRRVRTARNSFWLVESDMSSPVARPRVVGPVAWLEGASRRVREGGKPLVRERICLDFPVHPFGSGRPRFRPRPRRGVLLPAKHSAGSKLD